MVWFSASAGIFTNTFSPFPDGEINTENTYLFLVRFSLSCSSSFCLLYPSKSRHIKPECCISDASVLLLNVPLKHIAGNNFLSSCLSGLFFSERIRLTKSLVVSEPSLILLRITLTSLKNGVSVSLILLNMVMSCVINVKWVSILCRLKY